MAEAATHHAADADDDAAGHIGGGHRHQERLAEIPDAIDECAQQNQDERRARFIELEPLEAVVSPRAHHQKSCQANHPQP